MRNIFISNSITLPDVTYGYLAEVRDTIPWHFIEDAIPNAESIFILLDKHLADNSQHENLSKIGKASGIVFIRQLDSNFTKPEVLVETLLHLITVLGIDSQHIWLQVNHENDKTYIIEKLGTFNFNLGNIYVYNYWIDNLYNDYLRGNCHPLSDTPNFRFSVFSRRFSDERFHLYCDLLSKNLLKDFTYTFANCHAELNPYPYTIITKDDMVELAKSKGYINQSIVSWVENMPYASLDGFTDPYNPKIYTQMADSKLNLIIETGTIDDDTVDRTITEKTYKPIILRKPFMVFGNKSVLTKLKSDGFRTFEPYINESYAYVDDYKEKISMISDELLRLAKLTDSEFNELCVNLQEIADHNFQRFVYLAEAGIQSTNDIKRKFGLI